MLLDGEEQEHGGVKRIPEALGAGCGHLEFFFLNYKRNSTNMENKEQMYFLKTIIYSQF